MLEILQEVDRQCNKVKGAAFKEQHFNVIQKYKDFVGYLKKHVKGKISFNDTIYK